jgi:hypothetical protein
MMSRFAVRSDQPEIMDDLMCSGQDVRQALHELEVINAWLGGNAVTLKGVAELVEDVRPEAEITVADLGCGGGDRRTNAQHAPFKRIKAPGSGC